jgi:hypothetical protein
LNNEARQKLREIVDTYGKSAVDDPRRCRALLLDYCGQHRREIFVLNIAQEERVANDLQETKGNIPLPVLTAQLTQRLVDNRALAEDAARWAVEAWAYALRLTDGESITSPPIIVPAQSDRPPKLSPEPAPVKREPQPPPLPPQPSASTFESSRSIEVYGRPRRVPDGKWQRLGATPGSVDVPRDHVLGLRFFNFVDKELETWISEVQSPSSVVSLDLNGKINDASMAALRAFPNLTYLEVDNAERVTNAGMAHLVYLPHLVTFNFAWSTGISDTGLAYLRLLPDLATLSLPWSGVSDVALQYLQPLTKLAILELRECKRMTGAGLAYLKAARNLATLDLAGMTQLTDVGLQHIGALRALTKLDLSHCPQVSRQGIVYLRDLPNLAYLDLSRNGQIEDKGVATLCDLPRLSTLNLSRTAITDAGLRHVGDILTLLYLDLSQCELITDKGLLHLGRLKNLAYLNVSGCKRLTQRGLSKLTRPGLYVMR